MVSAAWPHTTIREIVPNIFFVTGSNITHHNQHEIQHSRNMIIIRDKNTLSLINTVRLSDEGLAELDSLGEVKNVIRIGPFHGRDDAFYLDRFPATLWALKEMIHADHRATDISLIPNGQMPFPHCSILIFETSKHPEGIIHIDKEGGILISCDSLKNWLGPDLFFSAETAKMYEEQGVFGPASISKVWQEACQVKASDFVKLKTLEFRHLLSAHGEPLLNKAMVEDGVKARYDSS